MVIHEETIKEITIAMINQGMLNKKEDSKETAVDLAKFINTLITECGK
ncbi:MAG TPA: hypothetical protein VIK86_05715 [Candidatus Paceibacterota bacterium]